MVYLVSLFFLLVSSAAEAEVYKCEKGGEVIFSDSPCDSEEAGFGSTQYSSTGSAEPENSPSDGAASGSDSEKEDFLSDRARLRKNREIDSIESKIADLQEEMNSELSDLRLKEAQATHNLDHTNRDADISQKIAETRSDYQSKIRKEREKLREAGRELRKMRQ